MISILFRIIIGFMDTFKNQHFFHVVCLNCINVGTFHIRWLNCIENLFKKSIDLSNFQKSVSEVIFFRYISLFVHISPWF